MELPVQISFRGVPSTDAIEAKVRARPPASNATTTTSWAAG